MEFPLIYLHNGDVIKWKHFPRNWPFVRGIRRSPVNSPHKGQWHGPLMCFFFICVWINGWVNNREASDLRRYRAHYDVTVMTGSYHEKMISFINTYVASWFLTENNSISTDRTNLMMTSWNGSIFRVTGPLWRESTGHRWIPLTKSGDAQPWCFLWSVTEQTVEYTIKTPVIWDTMALIMTSL